jgi:hypothetical protein
MNLDNVGVSTVKDSTAFKKIQFFSKTNPSNIFNVKSDFQNSFQKVHDLYLNDLDLNNSYTYGMDRQHTFTSLFNTLPNFSTLLDDNGVSKYFTYNLNSEYGLSNSLKLNVNRLNYDNMSPNVHKYEDVVVRLHNLLHSNFSTSTSFDFSTLLKIPNVASVLCAENDSKQYSNSFKFILNTRHKKKSINNFSTLLDNVGSLESFSKHLNSSNFSNYVYNSENTLKFKDYKSSNAQFLGSERTVRLLNNLNTNSYKWNTSSTSNTSTMVANNLMNYGTAQNYIYTSSLSN